MMIMGLLWVGAIWLLVWGLRQPVRTGHQENEVTPLELLRRRYARGEISNDEFEQAREVLRPRAYTGQTMRLEDEFEQTRELLR